LISILLRLVPLASSSLVFVRKILTMLSMVMVLMSRVEKRFVLNRGGNSVMSSRSWIILVYHGVILSPWVVQAVRLLLLFLDRLLHLKIRESIEYLSTLITRASLITNATCCIALMVSILRMVSAPLASPCHHAVVCGGVSICSTQMNRCDWWNVGTHRNVTW
jgi:hypothetical protein